MKKIRVLIVDDEPLAREGIAAMVQGDSELEVIGMCADGQAALTAIRAQRPDLVFLDVQMPKRDGFAVLAELKPEERPAIIFVTAYDQYAVQAFEICAIDYLLKPFRDARFAAALARAKTSIRQARAGDVGRRMEDLLEHMRATLGTAAAERPLPAEASGGEASDRVVLKSGSDLHFVRKADIIWVESQADFIKVHTTGAAQLVRETLTSFEARIPAEQYLRIHRSSLVNVDHVKKVTPALYGDYTVLMSDGTVLRLSRKNRAKLKQLISRLARPESG
jgi:two-component system, LytTR family, response regulator